MLRYDKYLDGALGGWVQSCGEVAVATLSYKINNQHRFELRTLGIKLGENETSQLGDDGCSRSILFWHLEAGSSCAGSGLVRSLFSLVSVRDPSETGDLGNGTVSFRLLNVYYKLLLVVLFVCFKFQVL